MPDTDNREPLLTAEAENSPSSAPKATGVRVELMHMLSALSGLFSTRIDLARLELQEAQQNIQKRAVWLFLALAFIAMAFLAGNVLLVITYWDTPKRETVLYSMVGGYFVLGLFALWRAAAAKRQTEKLFSSTIAEFEKDKEWLQAAILRNAAEAKKEQDSESK